MFKLIFFQIFLIILFKNVIGVHFTDDSLVTDICGLVYYKDKYHMFYQYFNLDANTKRDVTFFTKVSWGHATSSDLLNWSVHDKVIHGFNDTEKTYFRGQEIKNVSNLIPFSGSVIVDSKNVTGLQKIPDEPMILIFTSLTKFLFGIKDDFTGSDFLSSRVFMYYSHDGYKFERFNKALIEKSDFIRNYRDPVVYKYKEGHYNLVMCENIKLGIHYSNDLINWKKASVFDYDLPKNIIEMETPNLVKIKDKTLLIVSTNLKLDDADLRYCTVRYFIGDFDGYKYKVDKKQFREFDGPDFFAMYIHDGVMMGMINNWKYAAEIKYNGSLSYPRRINTMVLNNLTYLTQEFIKLDSFQKIALYGPVNQKSFSFNFKDNRPYYINIKLNNSNCSQDCDFELKFIDSNNLIKIGYTHSKNEFYLDRKESLKVNSYYNEVHKYKQKYKKLLNNKEFNIDLILDVNSVEMLTDQGLVALTALHLNGKIFKKMVLNTAGNYETVVSFSYYK